MFVATCDYSALRKHLQQRQTVAEKKGRNHLILVFRIETKGPLCPETKLLVPPQGKTEVYFWVESQSGALLVVTPNII